MIAVKGKCGIRAAVIADSINDNGNRITTFELEYPRFIHAEFMTHRLFSRNAASSRAIPVNKMIDQIQSEPAMPIHWGKNQAGMQANDECDNPVVFDWLCGPRKLIDKEDAWHEAKDRAIDIAKRYFESGYHKQIVNRLLEPFQMIKVVCTATEYDNFFHLRNHPDAQPEIHELASVMYDAIGKSVPEFLRSGEWHTPYVDHFVTPESNDYMGYCIEVDGRIKMISVEDALKVSSSCCAQVSYRLLDNSLDKAIDIYNKLVESKPVHASPFEHQATPMDHNEFIEKGVTHMNVNGDNWSGNLRGWIQHRQLIPDNTCWDYDPCE